MPRNTIEHTYSKILANTIEYEATLIERLLIIQCNGIKYCTGFPISFVHVLEIYYAQSEITMSPRPWAFPLIFIKFYEQHIDYQFQDKNSTQSNNHPQQSFRENNQSGPHEISLREIVWITKIYCDPQQQDHLHHLQNEPIGFKK